MNNRGVILLSVLWVVLVLSVISLSLAAAVRTEMSSSRGGFDSERAFFMARGAAEVMFQDLMMGGDLFAGSPVELVNGEYVFPFDTGEVRVRLESGRGRIDINQASDMVLASMFDSLGVDQDTRNRLVDSILDWRDGDDIPHLYGAEIADYDAVDGRRLPANGVFRFVDDILFVKGMTPEFFYGRLVLDTTSGGFRRVPGVRELVTTESGTAQVNPNETSADVLKALPGIEAILARAIVEARGDRFFDDLADLVGEGTGTVRERRPGLFHFRARRSGDDRGEGTGAPFRRVADRSSDPEAGRAIADPGSQSARLPQGTGAEARPVAV